MGMGERAIVVLVAVGAMILAGCDSNGAGGDDTSSAATSGTVVITSVSPSTGLQEGSSTSFTVEVDYTATGGNAELNIGFNTGSNVTSYIMNQDAAEVVSEGSGSHTFTVTATPKDWGSEGDFKVRVNISEYPHPDSWSPFDGDNETLTLN